MPGTKGIVTIGTMSESMDPPTVRPNPGPIRRVNMAKERRGEPESTSPGPHGMKKTTTGVLSGRIVRSPYKKKERVGEEARRIPGFAKEMAASGRKEKAEKLTRLMKKGYRKGYRVGKRPAARKSSGR